MGAKEAILVDESGNWLETSTGNLWGWHDGIWYTPHLDNRILPGIVRSHLLNWLKSQGIYRQRKYLGSRFHPEFGNHRLQ